jgi:sulfate permease, SulP family
MRRRLPAKYSLESLKGDSIAGLVLGVESVPDGLAQGLVAGVNPVFGLYAYLYGMVGAAFATSSLYMTVQATGAMSLVVSDVAIVHAGENADRALFTLALMTGVVMIAAGILKLGSVLRFVANSVMVGFMSAVGINIVLGQLTNFTGYAASGSNRLSRTLDLLLHPLQVDFGTLLIGLVTVALIVGLERTPLGSLGMVVAIVAGSVAVVVLGMDVLQLRDLADIPSGLPLPEWPLLSAIPDLIIPAISLSFVGLVQGAGITSSFPNPDGTYPDASRDFLGQGVGNVVSGIFSGMPVGGSTSATSLISEAGMVTNMAKVFSGLVMVVAIVFFSSAVSYIAMPALAALLIVIGVRTVKPKEIVAVWRTGSVQRIVMASTLILTIIVPLQYAVLVGVAFSMILHVIRSSSNVVVKRLVLRDGDVEVVDPPREVGEGEVVMLQLYGSIFFASAATYEVLLPKVTSSSRNSVVVLRLRGKADLGGTFMDLLARYAISLRAVGSRLVVMSVEPRVLDQLEVTGTATAIGADHIYPADDWLGRELRTVAAEAHAWVADHADPSPRESL